MPVGGAAHAIYDDRFQARSYATSPAKHDCRGAPGVLGETFPGGATGWLVGRANRSVFEEENGNSKEEAETMSQRTCGAEGNSSWSRRFTHRARERQPPIDRVW